MVWRLTSEHLPIIAPDEGLSAPFNSWFTLFGQFFDHGLDLVNKGGSGTVMIQPGWMTPVRVKRLPSGIEVPALARTSLEYSKPVP